MQGGVEKRRSSSEAVLRVLRQCQELEEDLAARNWTQGGGESGRSQTGVSEGEFERNRGGRMSGGGGGGRGGIATFQRAGQDESEWNAGEPPGSRPHSERSFFMRERHSKHTLSSMGPSDSHPQSLSAIRETSEDVQNSVRHSDSRFRNQSESVHPRTSGNDGAAERDGRRQPSWFEEESGGPRRASERASAGPERTSAKRGITSASNSVVEDAKPSWLEEEEGMSEAPERASERASAGAERTSERIIATEEKEHRQLSWLEGREAASEGQGRPSKGASAGSGRASAGSERLSSRKSVSEEKEHRELSWLDDEEGAVEGQRRPSERASERASKLVSGRAPKRSSHVETEHRRQSWLGEEDWAPGTASLASEKASEKASARVSGKSSGRKSEEETEHRRQSWLAEAGWAPGAASRASEIASVEATNEASARASAGDCFRSRSGSRNTVERLRFAGAESGEELPDQPRSKKQQSTDARSTRVHENRTSQGANTSGRTSAKSAERQSGNEHLEEEPGGRQGGGARAFEDGVEVLRLVEGEPSWTSAEPSGFLGRGEVERPSGSSRGASGGVTANVPEDFGEVANKRGVEEPVTEKRDRPERGPEPDAGETEDRKSSFGGSTIRAFFDEDTWHDRTGPPSVRESGGRSAANSRPASRLSEAGSFQSARASERNETETGLAVPRASRNTVSAARESASRTFEFPTRGSFSKNPGAKGSRSRFASAERGAERNVAAERPASMRTSLSGRNGPNGRDSPVNVPEGKILDGRNSTGGRNNLEGRSSTGGRNSMGGKASADGRKSLEGRNDQNGRNSPDGRDDLDGGENLDGWKYPVEQEVRGSLSGQTASERRNERNGSRAATNSYSEKRATSAGVPAPATRERHVAGRAPPDRARASGVQSGKGADFDCSNNDHPGQRASEDVPQNSARVQVSERGQSRSGQRVEMQNTDGEKWADKRVTGVPQRSTVRVNMGEKYQKGAHVIRINGWEATADRENRSRNAPSDCYFHKERIEGRSQDEERDFDEMSSEDGRSEYDTGSWRAPIGREGVHGEQSGWGSATRGLVRTARLKHPGAEITEKQRYEKEMEALSELVREYEANAVQKHRRGIGSGARRGQFLLEPDTGSTLLGTPVSELSLDLPTPPELRKKREALGGLPGKQTGGQPGKGAGSLKKSLAQTRQAAKEAIKSVRAVYCASGCATQQVREGERVWKQQLALARTSERELKARAQRAEVQATRLGGLLDWRVREVAHLKAALAERTARLDQAELRLDELERGNAAAGEGMREALKVAKKERDHILYLLRKALKQLKSADHQLHSGQRPPRCLPERFRTEPADLGASEGDSDSYAATTTPGSEATSPTCDEVTLTPSAYRGAKRAYEPVVLDDWAAKMAELQRSLDKQRSILSDNRRWS